MSFRLSLHRLLLFVVCLAVNFSLRAAEPVEQPLYPGGAPDARGTDPNKDIPTLTAFLPEADKASGAAVVICPGGGYGHLAVDHEGKDVANWFNSLGVAAFMLKYRLGSNGYHHPVEMHDAQRAMRIVRAGAEAWKIDPKKIGVMGFSAGGHLASTVGTHIELGNPKAADPIDRVSTRPDFMILCYPVISFTSEYTHRGSRRNLLGEQENDQDLATSLSNELQVTADTPPTFLFHTNGDTGVPPENSVLFYLALRKAKVPAEMHIYQEGKHGVGLAAKDPVLSSWSGRLADWLKVRGLVK